MIPAGVVNAGAIEILAEIACFSSIFLFTFIATFSRSEKAELVVQNILFYLLLACAAILWWLSLSGGSLWGSNYLPQPLSLFCIILAISAKMNIKGQNVSFGANPHNIRKSTKNAEDEGADESK
jgi:hypothetical protein